MPAMMRPSGILLVMAGLLALPTPAASQRPASGGTLSLSEALALALENNPDYLIQENRTRSSASSVRSRTRTYPAQRTAAAVMLYELQ